jgi:hypothetical protein
MFEVVYGTPYDYRIHKYHFFLLVYFAEKVIGLSTTWHGPWTISYGLFSHISEILVPLNITNYSYNNKNWN